MRTQWISVEPGDKFKIAADEDGYPAVRIDNSVWAGEEDRWITVGGVGHDRERDVRALAAALVKMADRMATERTQP